MVVEKVMLMVDFHDVAYLVGHLLKKNIIGHLSLYIYINKGLLYQ